MLTATSPRAPAPPGGRVSLWPHQSAMFHRALEIEANSSIPYGIMRDPPGAGKTFVLLSLLLKSRGQTTVVVVPQNIFTQWNQAIETFCPSDFRYKCIKQYADIMELMRDPRSIKKFELLITTSLFYHSIATHLLNYELRVQRLILDEVDNIEFMISKDPILPADFTWFVSASFDAKKLGPAYSNMTGNASIMTCQTSPEFMRGAIVLEDPVETKIRCQNMYTDILSSVLSEQEIRGLQAMDFTQVKLAHGAGKRPKTEKELLDILAKDIQKTIEEKKLFIKETTPLITTALTIDSRIAYSEQCHAAEEALAAAQKRLQSLHNRLKESKVCPICYDSFDTKPEVVYVMCCSNAFCVSCLRDCLDVASNSCPLCRTAIQTTDDVVIKRSGADDEESDDELLSDDAKGLLYTLNSERSRERTWRDRMMAQYHHIAGSSIDYSAPTKKETMITYLQSLPADSKLIIFSNYAQSFLGVEPVLQSLGIPYTSLDGGNIRDIDAALHSYKLGPKRVLLANSQMYGSGMNLENTTHILFIHWIDGVQRAQVIGRAQRPGRTCRLQITTLTSDYEEEHST